MNPYIFPILLDKTKIEFLKNMSPGFPPCREILNYVCNYFKISTQEATSQSRKAKYVKIRRYFAYLCFRIYDPGFIRKIKKYKRYEKLANKAGLLTEIKILTNRKQNTSVYNYVKVLKNETEIYKQTREEVVYLECNLLEKWSGGKQGLKI